MMKPSVQSSDLSHSAVWLLLQFRKLHQLDNTTAFLNGHLKEEVYMKQPEGFVEEGIEHLVCKLKQSLYGVKQSPRSWNSTLNAHLKEWGLPHASTPQQEENC